MGGQSIPMGGYAAALLLVLAITLVARRLSFFRAELIGLESFSGFALCQQPGQTTIESSFVEVLPP